jgi:hypothetical protein
MNITAQIATTDGTTIEKEQLWKEHAKHQRESGLSRVAYCRKHQLNYDQFGYWEQKWRQQQTVSSKLLPVSLNRLSKTSDALEQPESLCTLVFKNGHALKIHDKSVLSMLLSVWS